MSMTQEQKDAISDDIKSKVIVFAATASWPDIPETSVNIAVSMARRPDNTGRAIDNTDWIPTYDLNYAIALAWGLKAARGAGKYDINSGGQNQSRKQAFDNCLTMEKKYKAKIIGTMVTYGSTLSAAARLAGIPLQAAYGAYPVVDASDIGDM